MISKKSILNLSKNASVNLTLKNQIHNKFIDRLYVWGYAALGALGEPEFLEPTRSTRIRIIRQRKPWRLKWVDKHHAEVTNIACGNGFSLFSIADSVTFKGHNLFGMGMNTQSQIGVHAEGERTYLKYLIQPSVIDLPFENRSKVRILDISCGRAHSLVLTNLGIVSFGNNSYGQCARPIVEGEQYFGNMAVVQNVSKYAELESGDAIVSVKAGQDHSCFLTKNGKVLTCGWSADGQLGQEIYTVCATPKVVNGAIRGVKIKKIATKGDFVLALSDEGELFGWGNNEYAQLFMTGQTEPQIGVPLHLDLPAEVQRPILDVAASGTHCVILDRNFDVWVWGFGLLGRGPECEQTKTPLKIPSTLFGVYAEIANTLSKRPQSVACGLNCSSVIANDGTLFMWGRNKYGNLGTGEKMDAFMPLRVHMPAIAKKIDCGPDQTLVIAKAHA